MCRLKPYTKQMEEKNTSVAFRFDFYSMPSFRNKFVENAIKAFDKRGFTERLLTEEEKQTINIDTVCSVLDNSIEEVVSKKVYKLEGISCSDGNEIDLYISPYFLFIYFKRKKDKDVPWDSLQDIFNLLAQYKEEIDLQNISCNVVFQAETDEDGLWHVFDHDAFPTLDTDTMTVGRYADSHKYADMTVELVRIVRIGKNRQPDGTEIDPCYFVNITSIGSLHDNDLLGNRHNERLNELYAKACEEATKCFNG